jgi:homoserine dehydrogenase
LADITAIFADHNISVEAVVQKQIDAQDNAHIAIITNQVKTQDINAAAVAIQKHDSIQEEVSRLPQHHNTALDPPHCL